MFLKFLRAFLALSFLILSAPSVKALEEVPLSESNASQQQSNSQEFTNSPVQSITFPPSTPMRSFSVPGGSPSPSLPVPAHFAPPVTDGNFGNLAAILAYKDQFNIDDAEALLQNHGEVRIITTCYKPKESRNQQQTLRIVPEPKDREWFKTKYENIGIGNYKAIESNTISEQVLGIAIKEGLQIGADLMIFQEGASLAHNAKGYSFGFLNSFSFVNSGSDSTGLGNVAVGGIGYGKGESSYSSKPWLRVQFFREKGQESAPGTTEPPPTMNSDSENVGDKAEVTTSGPTPEEIYIVDPTINSP